MYGHLQTQSITGTGPALGPLVGGRTGTVYGGRTGVPVSANPDAPIEMSGSLTGAILSRGQAQARRRERRQRLKRVLWATLGGLIFVTVISVIVAVLAGDFITSLYRTLREFAG
ncbi:MAG TPA: hypothetical protein VK028_07245 [Micromonosporaceae bacterium]|nr:hypothetical protein [Micromonosporaceae bacterium]